MSKARARKIKVLLFDVDGVLTDGTIWLFPASPANGTDREKRIEVKGFHSHDGTGISLAQLAGLKTGIVTKRKSETVAMRARDLRMEYVLQGISDKRAALEEIMKKDNLRPEELAFVGDDVIDIPAMRICGLAIATANARVEVKQAAHVVTEHAGGEGAARDAIEYVLSAQGKLGAVIGMYTGERGK